MPETTSQRRSDHGGDDPLDPVAEQVRGARAGLSELLAEAADARERRAEATGDDGGAVCAWNHFENIPTFYNWNNRPR